MPKKLPDLCTSDLMEWQRALARILVVAHHDHLDKLPYRTGTGLRLELGNIRVGHRRMLTTVYRTYRDELKNQDAGQ